MNKVSYQTSREINRSFFSESPQNLLYDGLLFFRLLQAFFFLRLQLPTLDVWQVCLWLYVVALWYSASSLKSELSEIYDAITKTTVIYEVCMINI